ncbi:MAG: hypothetical protein AAB731_00355 [Patescibacteria group bacterium]
MSNTKKVFSIILILAAGMLVSLGVRAQTTTNTESTCASAGYKWCKNSDGTTGWCSNSATYTCPAYDAASCATQSGEWCAYQSGTGGWCSTPTSGMVSYGCPIYDKAVCESKSRLWCISSSGGSGWCANIGEKCPAADKASCEAQGSEWCPPTSTGYGSTGYCNTATNYKCPIYDQATCESKARKWCVSTYGGGWCGQTATDTCGATGSTGSGTGGSTGSGSTSSGTATMTWPSTETDCVKYKGKWCANNYSSGGTAYSMTGACMMGNQTCPVSPPTGKMTCWDNSFVTLWSECTATPTNEADCTAKGKYWCTPLSTGSATVGSGWCGANPCMKMPPSGQISCPDGVTFAASISSCPTASGGGSATTVEDTTKTCPDGSKVSFNALCSKICPDGTKVAGDTTCPVYRVCPDGTKVSQDTACPDSTSYRSCPDGTKVAQDTACPETKTCPDNTIIRVGKECLKYKICSDGAKILEGKECPKYKECSDGSKILESAQCPVKPAVKPLSEEEFKKVEKEKQTISNELDTLEAFFRKAEDEQALAKIDGLKEILKAAAMDATVYDVLKLVRDDLGVLRKLKEDLKKNDKVDDGGARDEKLRAASLTSLKRSLLSFGRQVAAVLKQISVLEARKMTAPAELKEALNTLQDAIKTIRSAGTYDEAEEAIEAMQATTDIIETYDSYIRTLSSLPKIIQKIESKIKGGEVKIKGLEKLLKARKLDDSLLDESRTLLQNAKTSLQNLKDGVLSFTEFDDFLEEEIYGALIALDDNLKDVRVLTNIVAFRNQTAAKIKRYEARLKLLKKRKQDVSEARVMLDDLKILQGQLMEVNIKNLKLDEFSALLPVIDSATDLVVKIELVLGLAKGSILNQEFDVLRRGLQKNNILEMPEMTKVLSRAGRIATFFRRDAYADYARAFQLVKKDRPAGYSRIASDQ